MTATLDRPATGQHSAKKPLTRLLVTGSRHWDDGTTLYHALKRARHELGGDAMLVHGACRGLDTLADEIWRSWGLPTDPHPIDKTEWAIYGGRAGYLRNKRMVQAGADLCLAFPLPGSKGTLMCASMAARAGIPVRVVHPGHQSLPGVTR